MHGGSLPLDTTFSEPFRPLYPASAKSTAGYDEQPVLPGHGVPGPDCGELVPYHCNSCGGSFYVESSCMMRECPNCMEKWAAKEARFAAWRMWTGSKRRACGVWAWRECRVLHVVVSIPDTGQGIEASRKQALQVAKKHNLDGGLMVYHPFRQDEDWTFVLDGFVHYHIIALVHGDVPPGGTDGQVLFKVIKDAEYGNYRGFRDPTGIRRAVHYLLSHCGILKGRHALTWWGSLSYNKLPNEQLKTDYPEAWELFTEVPPRRCPLCGSHDVEPCNTVQDFGWPSRTPIHHSPGYGVPWAT